MARLGQQYPRTQEPRRKGVAPVRPGAYAKYRVRVGRSMQVSLDSIAMHHAMGGEE